MDDIRVLIEKQNEKFREYAQRGDAVGLTSLYTDDGCFMAPNRRVFAGIEGIKNFMERFVAGGLKDAELTTKDVIGMGGFAVERGEYRLKMEHEGHGTIEDKGNYVVVWKKTPQGWKMHWDIVNFHDLDAWQRSHQFLVR